MNNRKTFLALIIFGLISSTAVGQKDVQINMTGPAAGTTFTTANSFDVTFTVRNVGVEDILATEDVIYGFFLAGNNIFGTGAGSVFVADKAGAVIPPGASWDVTFPSLMFSSIQGSFTEDLCVVGVLFDVSGSSPVQVMEIDDVNNSSCISYNFDGTASLSDLGQIEITAVDAFPNPAQTEVNFSVSGTSIESVLITDLTGKEVLRKEFTTESNEVQLNTQSLKAGVYLYSLITPQGILQAKRLVIE